jgi:hypothetical protein
MQIIRTAEELARAIASCLDPSLRTILEGHRDRLAECADEYTFEELAVFALCEAGDTADDLGQAIGRQPGSWEYVCRHGEWLEAVIILSDDGFGWVVLIPDLPTTDPGLLALCEGNTATL